MAFGLQLFNATSQVLLDTDKAPSRYIGRYRIDSTTSSVTDSLITPQSKYLFLFDAVTYANAQYQTYIPTFSFSTGLLTVTWVLVTSATGTQAYCTGYILVFA